MIRPQDKRPSVKLEIEFAAGLHDQIVALAVSLDSDVHYVCSAIVTEYFERNKPKATKERKPKQLKRAA